METDDKTLLEVKRTNTGMYCKCKVSDPIENLQLIKIVGEIREDLLEQINEFLDELIDDYDVPRDIKELIQKRKVNSPLIELIQKIKDIDNKEEKQQLIRDIKGLMGGK